MGAKVGTPEGAFVGYKVGPGVVPEAYVGESVGKAEGANVGDVVGNGVGAPAFTTF